MIDSGELPRKTKLYGMTVIDDNFIAIELAVPVGGSRKLGGKAMALSPKGVTKLCNVATIAFGPPWQSMVHAFGSRAGSTSSVLSKTSDPDHGV